LTNAVVVLHQRNDILLWNTVSTAVVAPHTSNWRRALSILTFEGTQIDIMQASSTK
jgi:hypothetical protein